MAFSSNEFDWAIENVESFQRSLDKLGKATSDFRIPFRLITSDFYRSQKQLFTLKGRGQFIDLSEKYKPVKEKKVGQIYPILVGETRDLSESTLSNTHKNSIYFLGRQELEIGSNVPYGKFHQSDEPRNQLPQRKFIFITGGQGDKSKDSGINGRRERWTSIIDDHVEQLLTGAIL